MVASRETCTSRKDSIQSPQDKREAWPLLGLVLGRVTPFPMIYPIFHVRTHLWMFLAKRRPVVSAPSHQSFIVQAMEKLMYAVATPVPGQTSRKRCVSFRPRTASDRYFVTITYGSGCSGTVRNPFAAAKRSNSFHSLSLQVGYFAGSDMRLTLQNPGCFSSGIIQHELLHILGQFFLHPSQSSARISFRFLPRAISAGSRFLRQCLLPKHSSRHRENPFGRSVSLLDR